MRLAVALLVLATGCGLLAAGSAAIGGAAGAAVAGPPGAAAGAAVGSMAGRQADEAVEGSGAAQAAGAATGGILPLPFGLTFTDLIWIALAILLLPPPYQWPAGIKRARKWARGALRASKGDAGPEQGLSSPPRQKDS